MDEKGFIQFLDKKSYTHLENGETGEAHCTLTMTKYIKRLVQYE
jgi:hypothetical protein